MSALFDDSMDTCYKGGVVNHTSASWPYDATTDEDMGREYLKIDLGEDFHVYRIKIGGPSTPAEAYQLYGATVYL